jgi:NAD(P)-dependent dehydrogenase (short-subunit alcohol dehydrogenase family)
VSLLAGRGCVVTGAGRGIGRHIAERFASEGANLALCARSGAQLDEVRADLVDRFGVRVVVAPVDVSVESEVEAFARLAESELGRVDVLVNNAGVYGPVGPMTDVDLGEWEDTLRIDLLGVVFAIRCFAPGMKAAGGGRIVNVAGGGLGGPDPPVNLSAYTCAKAAVVALTETLAREFAPGRVWLNALAPGAISTSMIDTVIEAGHERAGPELYASSVRQRAGGDSIEKVGDAALFLASERSGELTGRLISAKWDPLDEIGAAGGRLPPSRYTLRRIDGVLFDEVPR